MAANAIVLVQCLATVVARLIVRAVYRWVREIDDRTWSETGLAVAVVYSPLLSLAVGITSGIGVNAYSDSGASLRVVFWGILCIIGSVIGLAWGGTRLLRISHRGGWGWLTRTRHRLHHYTGFQALPDDPATAMAWIRRINRIGDRLARHGRSLTLRQCFRHSPKLGALGFLTAAVNLTLIVVVAIRRPDLSLGDPLPKALAVLGPGMLAAPVELVLRRSGDRWLQQEIGNELIDKARRAERVLLARTPPPPVPPVRRLWRRITRWWTR